jgi:hypothetical protein
MRAWPALALFSSFLFAVAGCGKKAMPSPRSVETTAPVCGLCAEKIGDRVNLAWRTAGCGKGAPAARFVVYRFREKSENEPCPKCPRPFSVAGTVEAKPGGVSQGLYSEQVEAGYRYVFKVVPVADSGKQGPESDEVPIE